MKIGVISITIGAIYPVDRAVLSNISDCLIEHYVDTKLMSLINQEGNINTISLYRMINLIARANEDKMDIIILTCTVFTSYIDMLQEVSTAPIISVDKAFLEDIVNSEKKTAILYTFRPTINISNIVINQLIAGSKPKKNVDLIFIDGAFELYKKGHQTEFKKLIVKSVENLLEDYDVIAVGQLSMIEAISEYDVRRRVVTSLDSLIEAIEKFLEGESVK